MFIMTHLVNKMAVLAMTLCLVTVTLTTTVNAITPKQYRQLEAYADYQEQVLMELDLHLNTRQEYAGLEGHQMTETERTESTVTFSRQAEDASTHSLTFNLDQDEATAGSTEDGATSFLTTSSRVTGACGKPLCKTVAPWQDKCIESVCYPLCLSTVFDVEVTGDGPDGFADELASPLHQNAIQGLFLGIGCSEHTGCCPKDERLATWTESKLSGAHQYGLPLPSCKHAQDRAAACAACSATVSVKPKGAEMCENFFKPAEIEDAAESFGRAMGTKVHTPTHRSYKEKCLAVNAEVEGAAGAMEAAFNSYVCGCLGCCDDQVCPHKIAFSSVAEAMAAPAGGDAGADGAAAPGGGDGAGGALGGAAGGGALGGALGGAAGGDAASGGGLGGALGGGGDAAGGLGGALGGGGGGGLAGALGGGGGGGLGGGLDGIKAKVDGVMKQASGKLTDAIGKAQAQLGDKIGELKDKVGGALDKAGLGSLKDKANGLMDKATEKLNEGVGKLTDKVNEVEGQLQGAVDKGIDQVGAAIPEQLRGVVDKAGVGAINAAEAEAGEENPVGSDD